METFEANLGVLVQWLLRATLQGSLLVCLIMLIKLILRERLPARWHYWLWLVLLIRLALPWAPHSRLSIYNVIPRPLASHHAIPAPAADARSDAVGAKPGTSGQEGTTGLALTGARGEPPQRGQDAASVSAPPAATLPQTDSTPRAGRPFAESVVDVAPWVWLGGFLMLGGYISLRAFRLWRAVTSERPVTDQGILELLEDCKMQMRVRTIVGVVVTDKVQTPALFGFLRPRILLPQGLIETLGLDDLHYVLLHELAHLKRRDIYLAWLVCLLQVLHWFNPLIWFAFRRMRADQEMAADALALAAAGTEESRRYGQTILSFLERFSRPQYLPSLAGILENPSHIERRMTMIARFKNNSYRWSPLAVALIVILCCISLPDARSGKAAESSAAKPTGTFVSGELPAAAPAGDSNIFVAPKTGITFKKVRAFAGPNDLIEAAWGRGQRLSPNGRFLLAWGPTIIPLDGGKPFKLLDLPSGNYEGYWSPDGKKVAFSGGQWPAVTICVVHVDPDTAKTTGSPKTLVEGAGGMLRWLPDSQRVIFDRRDGQTLGLSCVSIDDGTLTQVTDFSSVGIPSPDGENIAYMEGPIGANKGLWVKSVKGGPPRKLDNDVHPDSWSADGKWVHCHGWTRFIRIADGRQVDIEVPTEVGHPIEPSLLDGKKMYFCRSSYDTTHSLKVVSVSGGAPCELGIGMRLETANHFWWPDSQAIITGGMRKGSDTTLWALPLNGGEPIPFKTNVPVGGGDHMFSLSPDRKSLLVTAYKADDPDAGRVLHDVSVVPVSWQEMRTAGPAVLIFKEWHCRNFLYQRYGNVWAPDGKRVALADLGSIYVIPATGGDPVQVVGVPEVVDWLNWSPDGKMIAFHQSKSEAIEVVSSSGGEPRVIFREPLWFDIRGDLCWSPDSKAIIIAARGDKTIRSVSLADGSTTSLVNLKDLGVDYAVGLQFSPDGKLLAFGDPDGPLFLLHMEGGKVDKLPGKPRHLGWSPDGKWLSHLDTQDVKSRTQSVLWEMDIEEALGKLAK